MSTPPLENEAVLAAAVTVTEIATIDADARVEVRSSLEEQVARAAANASAGEALPLDELEEFRRMQARFLEEQAIRAEGTEESPTMEAEAAEEGVPPEPSDDVPTPAPIAPEEPQPQPESDEDAHAPLPVTQHETTTLRSQDSEDRRERMLKYMKQSNTSVDDSEGRNVMIHSGELDQSSQDVIDEDSASVTSGGTQTGSLLSSMDSLNSDQSGNSSRRSAGTRQKRVQQRTEQAIAKAEDEAEQREYLQRWESPPSIAIIINTRHALAKTIEKTVTTLLRKTARAHKAKMKGLDYRLKTKASLTRKILEKTDGARGLESEEVEEIVNKQHDILRYTMVIRTKRYTKSVKEIIAALEASGYATFKCKNYWTKPGESTDYMGINAVFSTPDHPSMPGPFTFELQFHTIQSLDTKMQRCHHSYSKFRESRSLVRAQYWEEMVRMWSLVPIPKGGVQDIGELVTHDIQMDRATQNLTEAERAEIQRTKELEEAVRPMCEEAVAHTMEAEKKVTPTMRKLGSELGFTLHGLDFRVKSALSMGRKAVSRLIAAGKTINDTADIEAEVWCEQRQALRYTIVVDNTEEYTNTVLRVLSELEGQFEQEFCYNYWLDAEPYNAVRTRMWSSELKAWCFIVFHTLESVEYSEARLSYHQQAMGIVFHTATFDEEKTAEAVQRLRQDTSCASLALAPLPLIFSYKYEKSLCGTGGSPRLHG